MTTKLPAIPAKNAGKREENGGKRWKTILAFCRSFAGDWCQNGVIVFCRQWLSRLPSLFWKIGVLVVVVFSGKLLSFCWEILNKIFPIYIYIIGDERGFFFGGVIKQNVPSTCQRREKSRSAKCFNYTKSLSDVTKNNTKKLDNAGNCVL